MKKQILFIHGNTLLLLQYIDDEKTITYEICDNVTLSVGGLWQGTCIVQGNEEDLHEIGELKKA